MLWRCLGQMHHDFSWVKLLFLSELDKLALILRSLNNRYACDFLAQHANALVVQRLRPRFAL